MSKWPLRLLGELVDCLDHIRIPVTEKDRQDSSFTIPYYGANGQVGWMDKALFNEPLLLIAEDGGHFYDPSKGVAYKIEGPSWVNNHAHILRPKEKLVVLGYLAHYFRHFDFVPIITGSTRAKLTKRELLRIPLSVPPLAEQERIVAMLDEADAIRKLRAQADQRTADLIPALFVKMFGDINFPERRISEVTTLVTSGVTPRGGSAVYVKEGPALIRSQNVLMNKLDFGGVARLPISVYDAMSRAQVQFGDVLLNITGASIGRVGWMNVPNVAAVVSQHVCIIRANQEMLLPEYLSVFLSLPQTQTKILEIQAGASRQALNHQQVRALLLPIPDLELQHRFSEFLGYIRALEKLQYPNTTQIERFQQALSLFA